MSKKLITTDEPSTIVQIALGVMFVSWVVAAIVGIVNAIIDYNLDGIAGHIVVWPIVFIAVLTINGTPSKTKWVEDDDD